jgi:hypothetical protein
MCRGNVSDEGIGVEINVEAPIRSVSHVAPPAATRLGKGRIGYSFALTGLDEAEL